MADDLRESDLPNQRLSNFQGESALKARVVPSSTINDALRTALDGDDPSKINFEELKRYITALEENVQQSRVSKQANAPARHQVLYRIHGSIYLDHPQWSRSGTHIVAQQNIHNLELFLERNKDICFIVFRDFNPEPARIGKTKPKESHVRTTEQDSPRSHEESIYPVARELSWALGKILSSRKECSSFLDLYRSTHELQSPYLFLYHGRSKWSKIMRKFSPATRQRLKLLAEYVFNHYHEEYSTADELLQQGKISPALVKYLFKPGEILVACKGGNHLGYLADSWPVFRQVIPGKSKVIVQDIPESDGSFMPIMSDDSDEEFGVHEESAVLGEADTIPSEPGFTIVRKDSTDQQCEIKGWRWGFDGTFKRQYETLSFSMPTSNPDQPLSDNWVPIETLGVYPLRFASHDTIQKLEHRGKMFWQCRAHCMISYREHQSDSAEPPVSLQMQRR
jgi:hypothetical protein